MYSAVFISDVHLGTMQNSQKFFELLKTIKCEKLFLVGDMISFVVDGPTKELDEFFAILEQKDCELIYLCGNHEKENLNLHTRLKKYYKNIKLYDRYIYKHKDKKILIEHGDSFHYKDVINRAIKKAMLKSKVKLYKNDRANYPKYRGLYYKVKPVIKFVLYKSYINYMVKQAKKEHCSSVICGHLHQPEIKKIASIEYLNCGDWLKSYTYITLSQNGEFKLQRYAV